MVGPDRIANDDGFDFVDDEAEEQPEEEPEASGEIKEAEDDTDLIW